MSAAADSAILLESGSDEEFVPSPPKRGRGRPKRNQRAATRVVRPRSARRSNARSKARQASASNSRAEHTVINVGDIDSDEDDTPRACSPVTVPVARAVSPIAIDALAQVLGVTDWSPFKTSEPQPVLSSGQDNTQGNLTPFQSTIETTDTTVGSNSVAKSHYETTSQTSNSSSQSCLENSVALSDQLDGSGDIYSAPAPAPKKTARRGLAKRDAGLSTTALDGFNPDLPDTAVYSQRVPCSVTAILFSKKTQSEDFTSTSETQSDSENLSGAESSTTKVEPASSIYRVNNSSDRKKFSQNSEDTETEQAKVLEIHESKDDEEDSLLEIRSPSPPPQIRGKQKVTAQRKRLNQKVSNALQTINNVKGKLEKLGKTTPKRKTRGRQQDVMFVGEDEGIVKKDMLVKVRYLSTVHRINMNLDDTLHSLTGQLSRLLGDVEEHELNLFLGDQMLDLSLTVRSANLSVADILNCHHFKTTEDSKSAEDIINLVVQCRHSRSKTTISAHKRQPMKYVIDLYAEKMGLDARSLRLVYDGEDVNPSDTPYKLEIEDMDIIDVIMKR